MAPWARCRPPTSVSPWPGRCWRGGHDAGAVDSVLAGCVAQASFDAYLLPRHIGLYAGVPEVVPALQVQRVCGTGLELLRQAGDQLQSGQASRVLCVAAESMTRNPIAAYTHRSGFRLGAPVEFHDFLWEALKDPAAGLDMLGTAERLAQRHGLDREAVDAWALCSFERALAAQRQGWFHEEIVPVAAARFESAGLAPRELRLPRGCAVVERDSHPRETSLEALARLTPVHEGGVQTAGNSCAVADGAAAVLLTRGADAVPARALAWVRGSCVVGVPPEVMGSAPVCRWLPSTAWRSTRPRAPSCWRYSAHWNWTRRASMYTAAPSPSVIRWRLPACAWPSPWPGNCAPRGCAMAWRRYASAAARAWRCCWRIRGGGSGRGLGLGVSGFAALNAHLRERAVRRSSPLSLWERAGVRGSPVR